MKLPIDVVPNITPTRFRWRQSVQTVVGPRTVEYEGPLPANVEEAVAELVALAKRQAAEIESLRVECDAACRRACAAEAMCSDQRQVLDAAAQGSAETDPGDDPDEGRPQPQPPLKRRRGR